MCKKSIHIVFFSSGESERTGTLVNIIKGLEKKGYLCSRWRDLFNNANDPQNIALLPMLIKKIPTFDFAILICEGHDITIMKRNNSSLETNYTMRDNVLFEIGLCTMALGLPRVILVTDRKVRMPEDLVGLDGNPAIRQMTFGNDAADSLSGPSGNGSASVHGDPSAAFQECVENIDKYMKDKNSSVFPVSIGAASSLAIGYVNNFIFRLLEHIEDGFDTEGGESRRYDREHIFLHVFIPEHYTQDTGAWAEQRRKELNSGTLRHARGRDVHFHYKEINGNLHICDFPTSIVTSYSTAKMILDIKADDRKDERAEERFNDKELNLFIANFNNILRKEYVADTVELNYPDLSGEEKRKLAGKISFYLDDHIFIRQIDYQRKDRQTVILEDFHNGRPGMAEVR